MDEYRFNCSRDMAKKFWVACKTDGETPGLVLRRFIETRVEEYESTFGTNETPSISENEHV